MRRLGISVSIIALVVLNSCTDYREEDPAVTFGVNTTELSFLTGGDSRSVTVSSGKKWDIPAMPQWISLQSITRSGFSPYEWTASFSAASNEEYNREGRIVIKAGSETAEISVSQDGKKGRYVAIESVSVSPSELTLTEGDYSSLSLVFTPSNASVQTVSWKSSSPTVATVSQSGRIDALAEGTTLITVTTEDGGKIASCAVTVKAKVIPVSGITLDKTSLSMTEGDEQALSASVAPTNATDKSVTWSSNNTSVATVSSSGVVTAKAAGTATITVTTNDGGKKATCSVTVKAKTVSVTGVSLNKTSLSMTVGDTQTLTATVTPSNATDKSVTWSSSYTSVASVSSSGVVTAKAAGTATITVTTTDGGKTSTCSVTVKAQTVAVTGVSLNKTSLSMTVGDTQTLTATITPSNATDKSVSWSSSNTSVATVSSSGVVTAKAAGSATITVTTMDGGKKATCAVTVQTQAVAVTGVSLNKTSMSLVIGGTEQLTATVTPSNATNKNVSWSSSNTSVATVDSNGNVSAIKVGTAIITVTTEDRGKTATCSVTVNPIAVSGVSLNQTSLTMTVGDTQTLTATVTPSNATDKSVTWSSNNTSVATVSSSGVVTAKAAGTATITVTTNDGGKKATCSVTVQAQTVAVTAITLSQTSATLTYGQTLTLSATVLPANASDKTLVWVSSNNSIASVSEGVVTAGSTSGTATITAKSQSYPAVSATCKVTVTAGTVAVTGVSLNKTSLSMTVGDTQTLTTTVTPSNATDKSVTWSSSNTSVATVSSSGVVTAKAAGSATITVTTNDGGKKATCSVTVQAVAVTGVKLDRTSMYMEVGDTQTLLAIVSPSNATDKSVTWSSSNSNIATVSSSGLVTAKAIGTAAITVTTNDGGMTAVCTLEITEKTVSVTGVSLDKTSISLQEGGTMTLNAIISPSNATNQNVWWSSSNESIVSVSSSGLVIANSPGYATITVTTENGGKKATCSVAVSEIVSVAGHKYIDLGLPSGLRWAVCNIGATKNTEMGDQFAWGETSSKTSYTIGNYKWGEGPTIYNYTWTKYNSVDNLTTLVPDDDAAHVLWGSTWRMPTKDEVLELYNNCDIIHQYINGINGYLYVSRINGNSIFFRSDSMFLELFWTSSLTEWSNYEAARAFTHLYDKTGILDDSSINSSVRYYGRYIRPVISR